MNRLLAVDKPPTCAGEWLMPPGENPPEPLPVYTGSLAVRVAPRARIYVHMSLGRYFTWGVEWTHRPRWGHYGVRLPFLSVGLIRGTQQQTVRATFMGWRGADHRPRPALRVWAR